MDHFGPEWQLAFNMKLINKDLKQRSSKFAPIPSVGMSPIQIVYIGEEIKHRFGSLKKKKRPKKAQWYWDQGTADTRLDALLHHAHATMFQHSETYEQRCRGHTPMPIAPTCIKWKNVLYAGLKISGHILQLLITFWQLRF